MCGLLGLLPTSGEKFMSIAPLEIFLLRKMVTCSILILPAVHTYSHTHTYILTHTYIHTCSLTHTYTHTYMLSHTHIYTYIHALSLGVSRLHTHCVFFAPSLH